MEEEIKKLNSEIRNLYTKAILNNLIQSDEASFNKTFQKYEKVLIALYLSNTISFLNLLYSYNNQKEVYQMFDSSKDYFTFVDEFSIEEMKKEILDDIILCLDNGIDINKIKIWD